MADNGEYSCTDSSELGSIATITHVTVLCMSYFKIFKFMPEEIMLVTQSARNRLKWHLRIQSPYYRVFYLSAEELTVK